MSEITAAVIGVGYMGRNHARIYSEMDNVRLLAVADSDSGTAGRIAKKYGIKSYTDYKKMLAEEKPRIVSIAVPTELHKEVSFAAMGAGCQILLEKPIAGNMDDAKEILEEAKKRNVKLVIGHVERFNPVVRELKKMIDGGKFGKIYKVEARRGGPFPVRISNVGVTVDLAVHDLDVINYLFGLDMAEVHAVTERRIHSSHEDMVSALVKLRTGELVIMNTDWLTPTKIRKLTVTGEKGMAVIDYLSQELFFYENAMSKDRFKYAETVIGISEGTMSRPFIQKKEPLLEEIEGFVNYVRNGGDAPSVSAEDAAKALEAALAILENSNGGGKK